MAENDLLTKAWAKMIGTEEKLGTAGYVPIYDQTYGTWRLFRNTHPIYPGAEKCADPAKVEILRRNASNLLSHYTATVPELEKLGIRVKQLLNHVIKTPADVVAWSQSVFNIGPIDLGIPEHVYHTEALAYDDFHVTVSKGRGVPPAYVVPTALRGSGISSTLDFSRPGLKQTFGPRNDLSKAAFADQVKPKTAQKPAEAPEVPETPSAPEMPAAGPSAGSKPRGRPRSDGLVPGSREAKAADAERRKLRRMERRKAAKTAKTASATVPEPEAATLTPETVATITQLPILTPEVPQAEAPRGRLIRQR